MVSPLPPILVKAERSVPRPQLELRHPWEQARKPKRYILVLANDDVGIPHRFICCLTHLALMSMEAHPLLSGTQITSAALPRSQHPSPTSVSTVPVLPDVEVVEADLASGRFTRTLNLIRLLHSNSRHRPDFSDDCSCPTRAGRNPRLSRHMALLSLAEQHSIVTMDGRIRINAPNNQSHTCHNPTLAIVRWNLTISYGNVTLRTHVSC
jgi:hypothetical protein